MRDPHERAEARRPQRRLVQDGRETRVGKLKSACEIIKRHCENISIITLSLVIVIGNWQLVIESPLTNDQ
jgi:hypothetical protein